VAKTQFIISNLAGAWTISFSQGHRGSFLTRAEAVREAVIAADAVQQTGQSVEVLVYADFEPYSVWSSDRDSVWSSDRDGYVSLR
jgi:hypothetical protein